MIYCTCAHCGAKLEIDEDDNIPGCRDSEKAYCPKCNNCVTTVHTSGIPVARVMSEVEYEEKMKFINRIFNN